MKVDLLEINENSRIKNEQLNENFKAQEFKNELYELIAAIMKGDKDFATNSKLLITKLNIKANHTDIHNLMFMGLKEYSFKLNKTNIKKVQKYIDKEGL